MLERSDHRKKYV